MPKSEFVCRRCGCAIHLCGSSKGDFWKHATGGTGPQSCRREPIIISRAVYEQQEREALARATATLRD